MSNNNLINISDFPKHIFWNYKVDSNLDEEIVIENVLLYGDIDDYKTLDKIVSRNSLIKVVTELEKKGKNLKRINFIKKILL